MRLANKSAIVTGAASGIGRAFAAGLAAEGASVVIADLQDAEAAAAEMRTNGFQTIGVAVDVASEPQTAAMVRAAVEAFGGVDILINNAALFTALPPKSFDQITAEEWQQVMAVNTLGPFLCAKAVVETMKARGGGRIINIASTTAIKGTTHLLHYVASKGAVIAFTRALARELGPFNITVNAIAPGFTLSEGVMRNPDHVEKYRDAVNQARALARDQHPRDLVGAACFLASEEAAFMTGQTVVVDGGNVFV